VLDVGLLHHLEELPRVGREALDVAPLALGVDRVERELDLPLPDSPVITISESRGRSMSIPLRLCSRAPRTEMWVRLIENGCSANVHRGQVPVQEAHERDPTDIRAMWGCAIQMQSATRNKPSSPEVRIANRLACRINWLRATSTDRSPGCPRRSAAKTRASTSPCSLAAVTLGT
jgi:hypothetical protein